MIPNLLGLIAMILVSRHSDRTLERRYHMAATGALGWDCFAVAWSASLTILLCCSFFRRGHRCIQLLARFLFDARPIPDWLLGSCWYCARDVRCQPGRVRWALHGRPHSAEDWQLILRLDFRGDFVPFLIELGIGVAKTNPACFRSTLQRSRRSLRDRDLVQWRAPPRSHQWKPGHNGVGSCDFLL